MLKKVSLYYDKKVKIKRGFTLAEVLITLGIIGIVAAITIPTLMKNTQDNEFKAAWKKEYSVFANATSLIAQDNGGNLNGVFDLNGDGNVFLKDNDNNLLRDKYSEKIQFVEKCSPNLSVAQDCFPTYIKKLSGDDYFNFPTSYWAGQTNYGYFSGLRLSDGAFAIFDNLSANCSHGWSPKGTCGYIQVDVNGLKPPNQIGRDIYGLFIIGDGTTAPFGSVGDCFQTNATGYTHDCNTGLSNTYGWSCSADYLRQ